MICLMIDEAGKNHCSLYVQVKDLLYIQKREKMFEGKTFDSDTKDFDFVLIDDENEINFFKRNKLNYIVCFSDYATVPILVIADEINEISLKCEKLQNTVVSEAEEEEHILERVEDYRHRVIDLITILSSRLNKCAINICK